MGSSTSGTDDRSSVLWRGAERVDPGSPLGPADPFDDDVDGYDADDEDAPLRRRNGVRRMAVLAVVGFLFAATVVTAGGGGADDVDGDDGEVGGAVDDVSAVEDRESSLGADPAVSERTDVDLGLSYGGAGGGATIRDGETAGADDGAGDGAMSVAAPLVDTVGLPRLPETIERTDWTVTVAPTRSDEPVTDVSIVSASNLVVVAASTESGHDVVALDPGVGSERWRASVRADAFDLSSHPGVAAGAVAAVAWIDGERSVIAFDVVDGTILDPDDPRAVATTAALDEPAGVGVSLPLDAVDTSQLRSADGSGATVEALLTDLATGATNVLAVDRIAADRLVLFVGKRLAGVRVEQARDGSDERSVEGELTVDWAISGVVVGTAATERGALLLVSDLRGRQQRVVDAVTGRTVTELGDLASSGTYLPAVNGVVVRRPATVGTVVEAFDLDGRPMWQLLGAPRVAIGDERIATATVDGGSIRVTSRS